jgi:hypothetical protein
VRGFGFGFLLQIVLFMNRFAVLCIGVFITIDEARCVVRIVRSEHQSRKKNEIKKNLKKPTKKERTER